MELVVCNSDEKTSLEASYLTQRRISKAFSSQADQRNDNFQRVLLFFSAMLAGVQTIVNV